MVSQWIRKDDHNISAGGEFSKCTILLQPQGRVMSGFCPPFIGCLSVKNLSHVSHYGTCGSLRTGSCWQAVPLDSGTYELTKWQIPLLVGGVIKNAGLAYNNNYLQTYKLSCPIIALRNNVWEGWVFSYHFVPSKRPTPAYRSFNI